MDPASGNDVYITLVVLFKLGALRRSYFGWGSLCLASLAVCPLLDFVSSTHGSTSWYVALTTLRKLLLLDFVPLFAMGFFLYMIQTRVGPLWKNVAAILVAMIAFHSIDHGKHNPVATCLILGIVILAAQGRIALLRLTPLMFISTISYPLYLCHNKLGCSLIFHFNHCGFPSIASLVIGVVFVFALATLVTTRIEQPISRTLRHSAGLDSVKRAAKKTTGQLALHC